MGIDSCCVERARSLLIWVQLEPDQKLGIEIGQTFCDLRGVRSPDIHQEACHDGQYILAASEPEHRS